MDSIFPGARQALRIFTGLLAVLVAITWLARLVIGPVYTDAGFYIPHALLILDGLLPYRDFKTPYAPGIYYLLALLGEDGLRTIIVFLLYIFVVQMANNVLVYALLRALGHEKLIAGLFSVTFAGLMTAAWGTSLQIEPFQNLFVLSALWLVLKTAHPARGLAVGLLLGAAVLTRQYALFAIPPLLLASVAPLRDTSRSATLDLGGRSLKQLILLLVGIPVPYLIFLLATGLDPIENLWHLATWGGDAVGYGARGLEPLLSTIVAGPEGRFLLPAVVFAAWLCWRDRSWRVITLSLGLAFGMLQLYVRSYEYYLQPSLPWAILVMAEFTRFVGMRFRDRAAAVALAAALITLPFTSIIWQETRNSLSVPATRDEQLQLAHELEVEIGTTRDVLVINASWLYAITRFSPPLNDFSFNVYPEVDSERRARARFAILFASDSDLQEVLAVRAWLEAGGLRLRRELRWRNRTIFVLQRP